jgi:hypothetical protein
MPYFECERGIFVKAENGTICSNCHRIFRVPCNDPGQYHFYNISQAEYEIGKAKQDQNIIEFAKSLLEEFSSKPTQP